MRKTFWLGLIFVGCSAAIGACGNSGGGTSTTEGTGDQGTGGHTASSSSSSSSGTGGSTTSSSSSSGSTTSSSSSSSSTTSSSSSTSASSSGSSLVNGCDPATAEDDTAKTSVTITFPTGGLKYSPPCIKVNAGTMVTFSGDFSSHPLSGGTSCTQDASSPITSTNSGTSKTFTLDTAGTYGFYCDFHCASGMEGAVFVQ